MPSRTATVIRPDIAPGRRVLAISDIHGNLPFLKGVLAKAGYAAGKEPGHPALYHGAVPPWYGVRPMWQL